MEQDPKHKKLKRYEDLGHARGLNWSCFHNRPFLKSHRACTWLAESIASAQAKHAFHTWAFCFMPTHVHLLLMPADDGPGMPAILKSIKQPVTQCAVKWMRSHAPDGIRWLEDRSTTGKITRRFWQRGAGYDRNLWSGRAIWNVIDYIHTNPVSDGLCKDPCDWQWSSAAAFGGKSLSPIPLDHSRLPPDPRPTVRTYT